MKMRKSFGKNNQNSKWIMIRFREKTVEVCFRDYCFSGVLNKKKPSRLIFLNEWKCATNNRRERNKQKKKPKKKILNETPINDEHNDNDDDDDEKKKDQQQRQNETMASWT